MMKRAGNRWPEMRRNALVTIATALLVVVFAGVLLTINGRGNGNLGGTGGVNAAALVATATATATDTPAPSPTPVPTATNTPLPTLTPVPPVLTATLTCADAHSYGPGGNPGTYIGDLCVHTVAHAAISVAVSFCGVHAANVISGMTTNASGDWSLTIAGNNAWVFHASCAVPFTVGLEVYGTAPNGENIAGSDSFTVSQ